MIHLALFLSSSSSSYTYFQMTHIMIMFILCTYNVYRIVLYFIDIIVSSRNILNRVIYVVVVVVVSTDVSLTCVGRFFLVVYFIWSGMFYINACDICPDTLCERSHFFCIAFNYIYLTSQRYDDDDIMLVNWLTNESYVASCMRNVEI